MRLAGLPVAFSLRQHVVEVLDQGGTNSCVAHAVAQAYRTAKRYRGEAAPLPSRLAIYWHSRVDHGEQRTDGGTYPRSAIKALVKFGVTPESAWTFSTLPSKVNRRPSWRADQLGADSRGVESYRRIFDNRADAIKAAIASGAPVVFGTEVDRAFTEGDGLEVIDLPGGEIVGRHALLIVGYDGDTFEIVNSWGPGWRRDGFARLTRRYVEWAESSDFQVLQLAS